VDTELDTVSLACVPEYVIFATLHNNVIRHLLSHSERSPKLRREVLVVKKVEGLGKTFSVAYFQLQVELIIHLTDGSTHKTGLFVASSVAFPKHAWLVETGANRHLVNDIS